MNPSGQERHLVNINLKTILRKCANWQIAGSSWLKKVPYGFGDLLRTIDYKYDSGGDSNCYAPHFKSVVGQYNLFKLEIRGEIIIPREIIGH